MVFFLFLLVNAGVAFVFFSFQKKRLSPVEILLYWCISSLLLQNYAAIQTMNLKSSFIPNELGLELAHFLNRTVLCPILSLIFVNLYCATRNASVKWICLAGYVALATGLEWLFGVMNVFVHVWWRMSWSALFWLAQSLLLIGITKLIRRKLYLTEAPTSR